MAQCSSCSKTILFGGEKAEGLRFCNEQCLAAGKVLLEARRIPPDVVARALVEVADGKYPVCGGPGPVELFLSHRVVSAVVVTTWKSLPQISCRRCATRSQLASALSSLLLGWWGIPWGLVLTPVQIARNLAGLARKPDRENPSKELEEFVRARLAGQANARAQTPASTARAA